MFPHIVGPIHTYGVMLVIGFYSAWILALRRARKEGVEGKHISDMLVYTVISGIAGARILYVITEWKYFESFWDIFKLWDGGLVFYGGLVTGAVTLIVLMKHRRLSIPKIADILGPSIALGLALGRVGCLSYGCCWGVVAPECPIAIRFPGRFVDDGGVIKPEGSPAFMQHVAEGRIDVPDKPGPSKSLPVVPTQPISSADCLLICLITSFYFRFRKRYGEVFLLFGLLYSVHRFVIEIFRINPPVALGLTISQLFSLVFGVFCLIMLVRSRLLASNIPVAGASG